VAGNTDRGGCAVGQEKKMWSVVDYLNWRDIVLWRMEHDEHYFDGY
jgi:hypothetical protein